MENTQMVITFCSDAAAELFHKINSKLIKGLILADNMIFFSKQDFDFDAAKILFFLEKADIFDRGVRLGSGKETGSICKIEFIINTLNKPMN